MLDHLRLHKKLAVLCALFLFPIGMSLDRLIEATNVTIALTAKERQGVAEIRPLWRDIFEISGQEGWHQSAVAAKLAALKEAADKSNLTLDTDLDSYYLQLLVTHDLPHLIAAAGRITAAAGFSEDDSPARKTWLAAALDDWHDDAEDADQHFDSVIKSAKEAAIVTTLTEQRGVWRPTFQSFAAASDPGEVPEPAAFRAATDAIWQASADDLDHLLARRIDKLHVKLYRDAALSLAALLLSAVLAWRIARSVSVPLTRLSRVMSELVSGQFATEVPYVLRGDEVGDMAQSVQHFKSGALEMDRLRRDKEQAERRETEERLKNQAALQESRETLQVILDTTGEGIYGTDLDGNCTFCNRATVELLGYQRPEDLLGRNLHDLMHHSYADGRKMPPEECRISAARQSGRCIHVDDEVFWCADGSMMPVEYWSYPQFKDGIHVGQLTTFLDITQRRLNESELAAYREDLERLVAERTAALSKAVLQAEAATQAKSNFLANMSHEIRTPMNAILGMTDLALRGELNSKQRDYLQRSKTAALSLLRIIDDILDFSKVEAGKLDIERRSFQLDDVLTKVNSVIVHKIQEKGLELLIRTEPGLTNSLLGDPLRLGQILINLVNNAVKFSIRGEIVVSVETHRPANDDGIMLKFRVKDSGIGMTKEQIDTLFRPFSQADNSMTRKYGGTGLGLAISRQLVELMDGEIGVESGPGMGSEFWFTALFGVDDGASGPQPVTSLGWRVLVVDDSLNSRIILQDMLASLGCFAALEENGSAALTALREKDMAFDLVLMDWKMPDKDGIETALAIRQDRKIVRQPKIVLTSAFFPDDIQRLVDDYGLDGLLAKPISQSSLLDCLMNQLAPAGGPLPSAAPALSGDAILAAIAGMRILLVEDNAINQMLAQDLLTSVASTEVTVVDNGLAAIEALADASFDAILMDVQMPLMDGFETTRRVRDDPKLAGIPIIAMTAHAMSKDREDCLNAGMNDYVAKPFDPEQLFLILAKWRNKGTM